jgi:hypothetical protein
MGWIWRAAHSPALGSKLEVPQNRVHDRVVDDERDDLHLTAAGRKRDQKGVLGMPSRQGARFVTWLDFITASWRTGHPFRRFKRDPVEGAHLNGEWWR